MLEEKVLLWLMGLIGRQVTVSLAVEAYNLVMHHRLSASTVPDDHHYCAGVAVSTGVADDWPAMIAQYDSEESYQAAVARSFG